MSGEKKERQEEEEEKCIFAKKEERKGHVDRRPQLFQRFPIFFHVSKCISFFPLFIVVNENHFPSLFSPSSSSFLQRGEQDGGREEEGWIGWKYRMIECEKRTESAFCCPEKRETFQGDNQRIGIKPSSGGKETRWTFPPFVGWVNMSDLSTVIAAITELCDLGTRLPLVDTHRHWYLPDWYFQNNILTGRNTELSEWVRCERKFKRCN